MNLKFYSILFSFLFFIRLHAQQSLERTFDCEELIFNTQELTPFDFNERCRTEAYPIISENGLELFYTHNQSYDWIFYSKRKNTNDQWSVPVPISIKNFNQTILSCYLSKDMKKLYFVSHSKVYVSNRDSLFKCNFNSPNEIQILGIGTEDVSPRSYISMNETGEYLYAYVGAEKSMAKYKKTGEYNYIFDGFVSSTKEEMGFLSNDGNRYYFTNDDFPYVLFCKKKNPENEEFDPKVYIVKTFETKLIVSQIRVSESLGIMTMVLSDHEWNRNDLYFLDINLSDSVISRLKVFDESLFKIENNHKKSNNTYISDVKKINPISTKKHIDPKGTETYKIEIGQAFPNPNKGTFYFYYSITSQDGFSNELPVVKIYDRLGKVIYQNTLEQLKGEGKVILDDINSGDYRLKIEYGGVSSEMLKISISK